MKTFSLVALALLVGSALVHPSESSSLLPKQPARQNTANISIITKVVRRLVAKVLPKSPSAKFLEGSKYFPFAWEYFLEAKPYARVIALKYYLRNSGPEDPNHREHVEYILRKSNLANNIENHEEILTLAVESGDSYLVELVLSHFNVVTGQDSLPLACKKNKLAIVDLLLAHPKIKQNMEAIVKGFRAAREDGYFTFTLAYLSKPDIVDIDGQLCSEERKWLSEARNIIRYTSQQLMDRAHKERQKDKPLRYQYKPPCNPSHDSYNIMEFSGQGRKHMVIDFRK